MAAQPTSLAPATPTDLLRALHKDEYYRHRLHEELRDALLPVLGGARLSLWRDEIEAASVAFFSGLIAFSGVASPGEEYCDLVPVCPDDGSAGGAATYSARALRRWAVLHVALTYASIAIRTRLRRLAREGGRFAYAASNALGLLTGFQRAHLALAYRGGSFLQLSRRLARVSFVRHRGAQHGSVPAEQRFDALALLVWLQLAISGSLGAWSILRAAMAALAARQQRREHSAPAALTPANAGEQAVPLEAQQQAVPAPPATAEVDVTARTCSLCYDLRTNTAATPCGHLFCWGCITTWATTKLECPVCRQRFRLGNVIAVMHYD